MIDDGKAVLSVSQVVTDMRMARAFMVQTFVQYAFVYRTVLDHLRTSLAEVGQEVDRRKKIADAEAQKAAAARAAELAAQKAAEEARQAEIRAEEARQAALRAAAEEQERAEAAVREAERQALEKERAAEEARLKEEEAARLAALEAEQQAAAAAMSSSAQAVMLCSMKILVCSSHCRPWSRLLKIPRTRLQTTLLN